jgi:predicted DCC family thiol-disulfide oxidoreductase YuxK
MSISSVENREAKVLPRPEERPRAAVVIFDGHCVICTGQIERLAAWDKAGRLAFLSLHDPIVAERYPDLNHDDLMKNMYVVDQQGRRYRGASAIRYLSRTLPRLWWLAPVLHIPGTLPLWQWLYQQVAKRRYRFGRIESCENGTCQIPRR